MSEFSRKTFVKGGGALIVGFSLAGLAGKARAADSPFASNGPFDQYQVDSWITINADNTASIKSGAISQGTGSITGILQIAAEELGMEFGQVVHVKSDTNVTPETGTKAASNTITNAGPGVRAATAWARQTLLGLASTQLGVPATQLSVTKGVVSGGGRTVTYGQLLGGKLFNVRMPDSYDMTARGTGVFDFTGGIQPGVAPAKPISQYTLVGTRVPSIEIPPIVTGTATYVDNVRIPGMLHGRVVLPRGQSVFGFGAPVVSVDEKSISHIKGARVVRKGDFVGIVAQHEYDAIQAAAQLKVKWVDPPKTLPGGGDEFEAMRAIGHEDPCHDVRHGRYVRRESVRRGRASRSADVATRRRSGSRAAHALGRDRLGQHRAGNADGHPRGHRGEGEPRRARLFADLPGVHGHDDEVARAACERDQADGGAERPLLARADVQRPEHSLRRQVDPAPGQLDQGRLDAGRLEPARDVRGRAGDRRACTDGRDRHGRVPASERHARADAGQDARGPRCGDAGGRVETAGGSAETGRPRHRDRPWHRLVERLRPVDPGGRDRGRDGEQEDRQADGQAHLRRDELRDVVNPGLVENQLVGGVTQITSRVMVEQMRFSKSNVVSTDFVSYPLLRFKDAPMVTPIVVQRMDVQPQGVGEPTTIAAPAAIANAFYDATGVRLRRAPFTPARVRAALKTGGVA